jgi:dihydropteroate synthase
MASDPLMTVQLRHARGVLDVTRPVIMGVVNASPESFSDSTAEANAGVSQRCEQALAMVEAGAAIIDIGGQSARTDQPEISIAAEIDRVLPLVEEFRRHSDACLSIDTYRGEVADAALRAGADIVNDVSGLRDPALLAPIVAHRAAVVVMHTRLAPKVRLRREDQFYAGPADAVDDVVGFLDDRLRELAAAGIDRSQVVVDPGPDFAKTPAQTVAVLGGLDRIAALGCPVLLALSRKDFVGAATEQPPRRRQAGTLAALGVCVQRAPHAILRVHDVDATRDYLAVLDVLEGRRSLEWDAPLADHLRYDH